MKTKRSIDDRMVRPDIPDSLTPGTLLATEPQAWEYQTVVAPDAVDLNEFGVQGWELIAVKSRPADQAVFYFPQKENIVSWSQADLTALETAMKSGTTSVSFGDRTVTYRSLNEMLALRNIMRRDLGLEAETRTHYAEFRRGPSSS